jgi:hypothetical protein
VAWKHLNIGKANEEIKRLEVELAKLTGADAQREPELEALIGPKKAVRGSWKFLKIGAANLEIVRLERAIEQAFLANKPAQGLALPAGAPMVLASKPALSSVPKQSPGPSQAPQPSAGLTREKLFALAAVFPLLNLSRDDTDQHVRAAIAKAAYQGHCDIPGLTDNAALVGKLWRGEKSIAGSCLRAMRQAAVDGILAR